MRGSRHLSSEENWNLLPLPLRNNYRMFRCFWPWFLNTNRISTADQHRTRLLDPEGHLWPVRYAAGERATPIQHVSRTPIPTRLAPRSTKPTPSSEHETSQSYAKHSCLKVSTTHVKHCEMSALQPLLVGDQLFLPFFKNITYVCDKSNSKFSIIFLMKSSIFCRFLTRKSSANEKCRYFKKHFSSWNYICRDGAIFVVTELYLS